MNFDLAQNALKLLGFEINPWILIAIGIAFIIAAVLILLFLKKILINSIAGLVISCILIFVLKMQLPLIPTLIISAIFGPAGIGVMLILKLFGVY